LEHWTALVFLAPLPLPMILESNCKVTSSIYFGDLEH
jgi:hypothetical protein